MEQQQPNVPGDWHRVWDDSISGVHPTYPTDGRETIFEPYETHAPTNTVGGYLKAARRVADRDPDLPRDFDAYLTQRVPSTVHFGTPIAPFEHVIDRHGGVLPPGE